MKFNMQVNWIKYKIDITCTHLIINGELWFNEVDARIIQGFEDNNIKLIKKIIRLDIKSFAHLYT